MSFGHPHPLKAPLRTPQSVARNFLKNYDGDDDLKHIIEFVHLPIIHITLYKDIMPYFDKFVRVYG